MKDTTAAEKVVRIEPADRYGAELATRPWSRRFTQFQLADAQRLGEIEHENAKLKRLLAVRDLEMELMRDAARKNSSPRR